MTFTAVMRGLALLIALCLGDGFLNAANAGSVFGAMGDETCSLMSSFGFTAGIVYCVELNINLAVVAFVALMQMLLTPYEGVAAAVAIALFGLKMMASDLQDPFKEGATLMFRILLGVFFFGHASDIYGWVCGGLVSLSGTYPNWTITLNAASIFGGSGTGEGAINEAIGWVTGLGSVGTGNVFTQLISSNCSTSLQDAAVNFGLPQFFPGSQVWQSFDCMFAKLMGAANPSQHPYEFATSLMIIIGAALFSATTGVIVAILGVMVFFMALQMLCRAIYLVLLSYICIGFMCVFMPLVAPLLFFESKYLTEKFKRLIGIIVSCIFQPVLVIGFLAMAITIDDAIIEGTMAGCIPPTWPGSGATNSGAPAMGYGQDGVGVCSFTQLFNNNPALGFVGTPANAGLSQLFSTYLVPDSTKFNWTTNGDPQAATLDGTSYVNRAAHEAGDKANVIPLAHPFATTSQNVGISTSSLKKYVPLRQLIMTLLTFLFATCALKALMETIPAIATNMTTLMGINLSGNMKLPLEDTITGILNGAREGALSAVKGKGMAFGNLQGPGSLLAAMRKALGMGIRGGIDAN